VACSLDQDQAFLTPKGVEDTPRMVRPRVPILRSVNQQHWRANECRGPHRRHLVHLEITPLAGNLNGAADEEPGHESGCPFTDDRRKIREHLRGDDARDAGLISRGLQRDGAAE
jgi:hypothetical protein